MTIHQTTGKYNEAIETFQEGLMIEPQNEGVLYALFYFYINIDPNPNKAKYYLSELVKYYPDNRNYQQIVAGLN